MNYAPGGMFGGMYGQMPMTSAGGWNTANQGGYGGMPSQSAMNSDEMMRQNFMRSGMARFGGRGMFGGFQGGPQGGPQMSTGYTVNEQAPQGFMWQQGATPGNPVYGMNPQMSQPYQSNMNKPMMMQGPQMSQPFQSTQQQAPVQQARPQQSFEDFASTLSGSGMTSGQMNDLYQKQIAKASAPTNFWQNVGPGGTQNPFPQSPQPFPQNWGQQRFNFDPRSLAGQQVTGDLGWYYGRDAIGRQINAQGDAVPTFRSPADGFQRTRPWFGGM